MKKTHNLAFALRENRWVSIAEVSSGKSCNCICPACHSALIAKKGKYNQHHFAHASEEICEGALETALHLFAKTVICKAKGIETPSILVYRGKALRRSRWESFTHAKEEAKIGNAKIDVLLECKSKQLAIAVKVTHATSTAKTNQLAQYALPLLEVDVARIYDYLVIDRKTFSLANLAKAILHQPNNREWLFHPWQHRYEYRLNKTARLRPVHISKHGDFYHYLVFRCPLRRRFVRSGFREGQSYARVFQDCLHCNSSREIVYQKEWVGFRYINTLPQSVRCAE